MVALEAATYRTIDAAFWTDPKVRRLSPEGRLLFLYLITNPHTHVCGLYYIPKATILHETGLKEKSLDTLSNTLFELGLCCFDAKLDLVWVRHMMLYQGRGEKNIQSAAHHISKDLHNSPLIYGFIVQYPEVKPFLKDGVLDRVSKPETSVPLRNTENRIQNTEKNLYIVPPQDTLSDRVSVIMNSFGEFGWVKLTAEQERTLREKLNGCFDEYIARFDNWVEEAPDAKTSSGKRRDRKAYQSICNWFSRDNGKGAVISHERETREEQRIRKQREALERANQLLPGPISDGIGPGGAN